MVAVLGGACMQGNGSTRLSSSVGFGGAVLVCRGGVTSMLSRNSRVVAPAVVRLLPRVIHLESVVVWRFWYTALLVSATALDGRRVATTWCT